MYGLSFTLGQNTTLVGLFLLVGCRRWTHSSWAFFPRSISVRSRGSGCAVLPHLIGQCVDPNRHFVENQDWQSKGHFFNVVINLFETKFPISLPTTLMLISTANLGLFFSFFRQVLRFPTRINRKSMMLVAYRYGC